MVWNSEALSIEPDFTPPIRVKEREGFGDGKPKGTSPLWFPIPVKSRLPVNSGGFGLAALQGTADAVEAAVFDELGPGLPEVKRHAGAYALLPDIQHPGVIAGAGEIAGFAAHGNLVDLGAEIGGHIYGPEQGFAGDAPPLERRGADFHRCSKP